MWPRFRLAPWAVLPLCACWSSSVPNDESGAGGSGPVCSVEDPGHVTLHRLNRAEYDATVRDLLGTSLRPARDFPADDHGYGFDNVADVLSLAPLLFEKYEGAADALVTEALRVPLAEPVLVRIEAEDAEASAGGPVPDGWNLWSAGEVSGPVGVPLGGEYAVTVRAYGQQAGADPVRMAVKLDAQALQTFDVPGTLPEDFTFRTRIGAGNHTLAVEFLNDFYDPLSGEDRNLIVDRMEVEGPFDVPTGETNPIRERLLTCDPESGGDACAREILEAFATRAWRRPAERTDVDYLAALVGAARSAGDSGEESLALGLKAVLLSPRFLFRPELDADPNASEARPLDGWSLASRLSYFLWSSMPDDELFAAAASGALADPAELERQARRMLSDPKAEALVENFAGQWLYTRKLDEIAPDARRFPAFDEGLRASMRAETDAFFRSFVQSDRSFLELVDAKDSFVDDRLAGFYGLPLPDSASPVEISLEGTGRRGILGKASLLAGLSHPARTSPVKRGKWVLEQLLCDAPPAPPPGVPSLPDGEAATGTMRERMEAHRANPGCSSCHTSMDPIGFALESFDPIGAFRESDDGAPIDTSGSLPDGRSFDGAEELAELIAADPRLPGCMVKQLFTYALGRGPTDGDACALSRIEAGFASRGHRFADLVVEIVTSAPFRTKRGGP